MTKRIWNVTTLALVVGLALPAVAYGQAIPRTASGGSSSSGGSSGSSGSSGGATGSVGGGGVSQPPSGGGNTAPSRIPTDTSGLSVDRSGGTRGHAAVQPVPGGVAVTPTKVNATSAADRRTGVADDPQQFSSSLNMGRQRGDNPITGFAAARQPIGIGGGGGGDFVSFPFWGPWGSWYPWYGAGFGWGVGYYGFNPWYYGATCWTWGRWGTWYDPFGYCWNPMYYGPATYVEIAGTGGREKLAPKTGNVRISASPKNADVYVDDALVGKVDEFDGLNEKLELATGRKVISVKAEGYQPVVKEVVVEGGRTVTVRIDLKKIK